MAHKFPLIAAAVATAVASGYATAAVPTLAQAAGATNTLVIAGSSAAANGFASAIEKDICGGSSNTLIAASAGGSKNFLAYSCTTAVALGTLPANNLVTIYYRTEGGSVVGALPIVSGAQIKRLNLSDSSCVQAANAVTCTVNGVTATAGPADSWTGAVVADTVQLGVTDVEPAQLTGADYPSAYSTAAFGTATPAQLKGLSTSKLFQQVFGLVVNTSGQTFTTVNLSKASAADILVGKYSDWSLVPDAASGAPISSASSAITRIDRENGSGTRTATNIYFLGYQCGSANAIANGATEALNFSTTDELTAANGIPGAIAYAGIDNILNPSNKSKWTNLALVSINGVSPTNLAAAAGEYDYWFEATLVPNSAVSTSSVSGQISTFLQGDLPKLANAPALPDINVIPGVGGNLATVPLKNNGGTGTTEIYVNPFSRAGNSCNVPSI